MSSSESSHSQTSRPGSACSKVPRAGDSDYEHGSTGSDDHHWRGRHYGIEEIEDFVPDPIGESRVKHFQILLEERRAPFTCGGHITKDMVNPKEVEVYYTNREKLEELGGTSKRPIDRICFPADQDDLERFIEAATPASLGKGRELVYDTSSRLAREIQKPDFALALDPVAEGLVIPEIMRELGLTDVELVARIYKINVYDKGGFFKPHRDTPRGEGHIGTITLCLPTEFTGGELVVRHRALSSTFDWGRGWGNSFSRRIHWAFLYSDCEHEILPITSGTRVSVAYDVWSYPKKTPLAPATPTDVPVESDAIDAYFEELLEDNVSFLPSGGHLAFGLEHEYSIPADNICVSSDKASNGSIRQSTIWAENSQEWEPPGEDGPYWARSTESVPKPPRSNGAVTYRRIGNRYPSVISDTFSAFNPDLIDDDERDESALYEEVRRLNNGSVHKNAIWVTAAGPTKHKNYYTWMGNAPEEDFCYVSVAILASIPPGSERAARRSIAHAVQDPGKAGEDGDGDQDEREARDET